MLWWGTRILVTEYRWIWQACQVCARNILVHSQCLKNIFGEAYERESFWSKIRTRPNTSKLPVPSSQEKTPRSMGHILCLSFCFWWLQITRAPMSYTLLSRHSAFTTLSLKAASDLLKSLSKAVSKDQIEIEKFDIYFCVFFDCYCQRLISGRETEH